jgi:hypothetical protein
VRDARGRDERVDPAKLGDSSRCQGLAVGVAAGVSADEERAAPERLDGGDGLGACRGQVGDDNERLLSGEALARPAAGACNDATRSEAFRTWGFLQRPRLRARSR